MRLIPGLGHPLLNWPPIIWAAFLLAFSAASGSDAVTRRSILHAALLALTLVSCASINAPKLPYPAFIQVEDLPDMYIAALPGVTAKPLAGDTRTRTSSNLVTLPADWKGTTGGAPGKSVELFVISGKLTLSEFELTAGGYAYVPPGSLGFSLSTDDGAQLLYFLDDVDRSSVIRSPIVLDSKLVDWSQQSPGRYERELRNDPGSGARTWLLRIEPGATTPWQSSSAVREGFMYSGQYQDSECLNGEAQTGHYLPGGYFLRPPEVWSGGPEAIATTESTWFLREQSTGEAQTADECVYTPPVEEERG